jgi:Flp pilus assembly protein TadG
MIGRLLRQTAGSTAVEFALTAPTFLMFLFLILDGGRMMFAKQAVNELAAATARCAAVDTSNCSSGNVSTWATTRGRTRSNLAVTNVQLTKPTTCASGQSLQVAKATVTASFKRGALFFLPQSVVPTSISSTACFPV